MSSAKTRKLTINEKTQLWIDILSQNIILKVISIVIDFCSSVRKKNDEKRVFCDFSKFLVLNFTITSSSLWNSFSYSAASLFVWNQIPLLCPFHSFSFGSNLSPAISFHRAFMVYCCFYRQHTNQKWREREFSSLRKSTKRTNPVSSLRISILKYFL